MRAAMPQAGCCACSPGVYAGVIGTAVVGMATVPAMAALRRLLHWRPEFNPR